MRRIQIYDTTLRDGAQGEGISFSLPDKLALTERLDQLGFDYVEGGYPASNEKDFQYFQRIGSLGLKRTKVCAFGMTRRKNAKAETDAGLKALLDSGAAVITLVGKTSAFHAVGAGTGYFPLTDAGIWRVAFEHAEPVTDDPAADWAIYSGTLTFEAAKGAGQ